MRRLILLRHAKAERPVGLSDLSRPLAARGRRDAVHVGQYMAQEGLLPDKVIVSPSRRTMETWDGLKGAFKGLEAESVGALYDASSFRLLTVIRGIADEAKCLLVIGHNPGMEDLAIQLSGSGDQPGRKAMREKFPTAALAVIAFDREHWNDIDRAGGRLLRFVVPRSLGASEAD